MTQNNPGPPAQGIQLSYNENENKLDIKSFDLNGLLGWSPVFSDNEGNFLCYSNSFHLYDSIGRVAINGDRIAVGYTLNFRMGFEDYHRGYGVHQSAGIIPLTDSLFYLFHSSIEDWSGAPNYAIIDLLDNGNELPGYSDGVYFSEMRLRSDGRLEIVEEKKKIQIILDTLVFNPLTFVKHANGRDWWLLCPEHYSDEAYLFKVKIPSGEIENRGKVYFSVLNDRAWNARTNIPSPDGQYLATFLNISSQSSGLQHKLEIKKFDRCTGLVEPYLIDSLPVANKSSFGGEVEWSESGRFLYVSIAEYILQLDMELENPFESIDTIAHITEPAIYRGSFPEYPDEMWRLPNGEILTTSFNATPYISYIREPDEKGMACRFEYVADTLPPDTLHPGSLITISTLPTYPPYRMPSMDNPCEVNNEEVNTPSVFVSLYPNPAVNEVSVQIQGAKIEQAILLDLMGRPIKSSETGRFTVHDLKQGVYLVSIDTDQGNYVRKLVVQ